MIYREIPLQLPGSLPGAKLVLYMQDYSENMLVQERPCVILCPGGGYQHVSEREGESEALQFLSMGMHAAVLQYSVAPARYPVQLTELAWAMRCIKEHAAEWHVLPDKIIVQGSSAGGHLAACLGMFWKEEWLRKAVSVTELPEDVLRPAGLLLCYPVITSGEYAHRGSFENLLGQESEKRDLLEKLSLENQVSADTPPVFVWHTLTDGSVPAENSLLLVSALRRHHIPTEFHLYPEGHHGLALAGRLTASRDGSHMQECCTSWIGLAKEWLEGICNR